MTPTIDELKDGYNKIVLEKSDMRLCLPRGSESGVFYCYRDRSSAVSMMHL